MTATRSATSPSPYKPGRQIDDSASAPAADESDPVKTSRPPYKPGRELDDDGVQPAKPGREPYKPGRQARTRTKIQLTAPTIEPASALGPESATRYRFGERSRERLKWFAAVGFVL